MHSKFWMLDWKQTEDRSDGAYPKRQSEIKWVAERAKAVPQRHRRGVPYLLGGSRPAAFARSDAIYKQQAQFP